MAGLDSNIFFQRAALEQQNAANLQNQLSSAIKLFSDKKGSGLDVVKLAEAAAYKKASGLELSPEEDALAMGWDKIQSSGMALDPLGRPYQKQRPVFGESGPAESGIYSDLAKASKAGGYTPSYTQPSNKTFPDGFVNGSPADVLDDPSQYNTMTIPNPDGNGPPIPGSLNAAQFIDQPKPIRDTPASVAESLGGRLDSSNPEVLKADIDVAKTLETEAAKNRQTLANEDAKKAKGKETFQRSLERMAEITEELKRMNAIAASDADLGSNAKNLAAASGIGQFASRAADPKAQALRDEFLSLRNQLGNAVMAADGMSSKQMDSNAEREAFMKSLGGPDLSYEANMSIQDNLGNRYGLGAPKRSKGPDLQSLKSKYGLD